MDVISQPTVMVNAGRGVHNDVSPDMGVCMNDSPSHDHGSGFEVHRWRNPTKRVNQRDPVQGLETCVQKEADSISADSNDSLHT